MYCRAYAASTLGVEGYVVTVEAEVGPGLPGLRIVGQATGALHEARDRVRSALSHCGHDVPPRKQVVNLAPADLRKDSPGVDLGVACALLAGHGFVAPERLDKTLLWGELGLDGAVRPVPGTLVVADCARREGFDTFVVSKASLPEAVLVPGLRIYGIERLDEWVAHLRGERELVPGTPESEGGLCASAATEIDLRDVRGLALGKLAIEVMVAGGHNLLFHGPPGVGKTMLARRAAALFPPLTREAAVEVTKIHSVASGLLASGLVERAPIRAPHHTVSVMGLLGGGSPPRPGEVTLAHHGLLFLDELPEFSRGALEGLREPLEDGFVTIVRARHALRFPSRFQLMAAMNPCPCGYLGHPRRACSDPAAAVERYQRRVSGPFLDRMDLVVPLAPASPTELEGGPGEASTSVRTRIERAVARQRTRLAGSPWLRNAQIPAHGEWLETLCRLSSAARTAFARLARAKGLSPRVQHRVLRVARTLVDLDPRELPLEAEIEPIHLAQALQLRVLPTAIDTAMAGGFDTDLERVTTPAPEVHRDAVTDPARPTTQG